MTIPEVERLLGEPARKIDRPSEGDGPVVKGERYYEFGKPSGYIQISTRGDRVAEKFYFYYSL